MSLTQHQKPGGDSNNDSKQGAKTSMMKAPKFLPPPSIQNKTMQANSKI
jgi:hypothetical protein